MMHHKTLVLTSIVFLVLFSVFSMAEQLQTLMIWIEGTLGVGPEYDQMLVSTIGEKNGTWVTIHNTGNIRDVLRMEGYINDTGCWPSGTNCQYKDWIKFSFQCAESVGLCDDFPSSDMKYVEQIVLTPEIDETKFYVEVTGYKLMSPGQAEIIINGYSLSNHTKESGIIRIGLEVRDPTGAYESEELPEISLAFVPLLFLLSGLVFYKKAV